MLVAQVVLTIGLLVSFTLSFRTLWIITRISNELRVLRSKNEELEQKIEIVNLGVVGQIMEKDFDKKLLESILDTQARLYNLGAGLKSNEALREARRLHGLLP